MAYLGSWKIDDYLPIPVTTHRFSSGAAYAPTSLTYSIYEDATATGLYEDVDMTVASPFDTVTGFYLSRVQLTAAAGFEKGKNYTVLIKATVDSVAAIAAHTFQIEAEVDANMVSDKTAYGLADDAITAAKFDESTAFPVKSADTGATQIARVGADSDTLETLSDQLDATALEATLTAIKGAGWSDETLKAIKDAVSGVADAVWDEVLAGHISAGSASLILQAIKAKTDLMDVAAINVVSPLDGENMTLLRGDTFEVSIEGLGDITGYVSIDFTAKYMTTNTDDEAIIRVRKNATGIDDGLLRLNQLAGTANQGSISIVDLVAGDIDIWIDELATIELVPYKLKYDIQVIYTDKVQTRTSGVLTISGDITNTVV